MLAKIIGITDPRASYHAMKRDIDSAITEVLESQNYVLGPHVERFERAFADFIGQAHGVGVKNGTDAIHLVLRALGIGPGDEVITVSHTSVATVAAIEMAGAKPVLIDVDPTWWTIDPAAAAAAVTPRTCAIVAVHLYGQPADLTELGRLCDREGLALIEDCAQSHGATWRGRMTGSVGAAGCFSFYPTKILGGIGDGGMVLTGDEWLAGRVRMLRQYGWERPQHSAIPGFNSRLDALQAAILGAKLKHLAGLLERRRSIAQHYRHSLDAGLELSRDRDGGRHAYNLFVVRAADHALRQALLQTLKTRGVQAMIHYPVPVHLQPAYAERCEAKDLPVTEALAETVLSLPLYPELDVVSQRAVIKIVNDHMRALQ